jgi:hypothetical protein
MYPKERVEHVFLAVAAALIKEQKAAEEYAELQWPPGRHSMYYRKTRRGT